MVTSTQPGTGEQVKLFTLILIVLNMYIHKLLIQDDDPPLFTAFIPCSCSTPIFPETPTVISFEKNTKYFNFSVLSFGHHFLHIGKLYCYHHRDFPLLITLLCFPLWQFFGFFLFCTPYILLWSSQNIHYIITIARFIELSLNLFPSHFQAPSVFFFSVEHLPVIFPSVKYQTMFRILHLHSTISSYLWQWVHNNVSLGQSQFYTFQHKHPATCNACYTRLLHILYMLCRFLV